MSRPPTLPQLTGPSLPGRLHSLKQGFPPVATRQSLCCHTSCRRPQPQPCRHPQSRRAAPPSCTTPAASAVFLGEQASTSGRDEHDASHHPTRGPSTQRRGPWTQSMADSDTDSLSSEEEEDEEDAAEAVAAGLVPPAATATQTFSVLNFYHLVDVPNALEVVEQHRVWLETREMRGRIYISPQGINAQCGGVAEDAAAYAEWVAQQPLFKGLRYSLWPAPSHTFPRLRLKFKPNLVSVAGGMAALPVTDPTQRSTPVQPAQWKRMMAEAQQVPSAASLQPVVLDVRNDYEWDAGHFRGAARPAEEFFAETPVSDDELGLPTPLLHADPDTPVLMYCTGGIRCDVYSAFLRRRGFTNLFSLEGGVQSYLREEGGDHWNGSLYVFDGRMAIPPGVTHDSVPRDAAMLREGLPAAVPCQLCGSSDARLPHLNCCNIDCNQLFIACPPCKARLGGCCCEGCTHAPRLGRPMKTEGGHYATWVSYANQAEVGPLMAMGRQHEGRLARRARRRDASKERREPKEEERRARKAMVREATVRIAECETVSAAAAAAAATARQQGPDGPSAASPGGTAREVEMAC